MTTASVRPSDSQDALPWLWEVADRTYQQILRHPFLRELADGSLPRRTFRHYLVQDTLYLREYARALRVLAARAPDDATAAMFGEHAAGAVAAERSLHADVLAELGRSLPAEERRAEASPTTLAYTSYLLATVHGGSFAEGLAAVLPCYWIYWKVGRALAPGSSPDPLFARWIATYGGVGFGDVAAAALAVTDRVGATLGVAERERMRDHFRIAARYEWMFWDAAYRREGWPL
ncbi:MAG TPA: thiaminase II [Pseudonocardia sp.]|jgi:thiaminase (transcriptional activator TenA)|nr:thiaminase II [Pseudonocardia sp.]